MELCVIFGELGLFFVRLISFIVILSVAKDLVPRTSRLFASLRVTYLGIIKLYRIINYCQVKSGKSQVLKNPNLAHHKIN